MSPRPPETRSPRSRRRTTPEDCALLFAALGDPTRLRAISQLTRSGHCSLTQLTHGAGISRQGMTKHLHVLERAGLVRCTRAGRESRFQFNPAPLGDVREVLDQLSAEWGDALSRLKHLVDDEFLPLR